MSILKKENLSYCDILFPVYNKIETTKLTLESIINNTVYPYKITFIVDDSKIKSLCPNLNEMPDIINKCNHIIISKERVGIINAYNQALRITKGNHVAFIMDDFLFPKGWLNKLVSATNKIDKLGMAGCYNEARVMHERRHREYKPNFEKYDDITLDLNGIIAPPSVMKRSVIAKIGLWHNGEGRFGYRDYIARIKKAGFILAHVEGTQAMHFHVICEKCHTPLIMKTRVCQKCGWNYDENWKEGRKENKTEIQNPQGSEIFNEDIPDYTYGDKL